MKTLTITLSVFTFSAILFSCQKTETPAPHNLVMDIESCKPKDKKNLYVGKEYQGGIIFQLDETGKHGLIVAKEDLGPAPWGCYGTSIPEAQNSGLHEGLPNTLAIVANCPEPGTAARISLDYEVLEKGDHGKKYRDWYLPDAGEILSIIQLFKELNQPCCLSYWSSSEVPYDKFMGSQQMYPDKEAWRGVMYSTPYPAIIPLRPTNKSSLYYVRPIRNF